MEDVAAESSAGQVDGGIIGDVNADFTDSHPLYWFTSIVPVHYNKGYTDTEYIIIN